MYTVDYAASTVYKSNPSTTWSRNYSTFAPIISSSALFRCSTIILTLFKVIIVSELVFIIVIIHNITEAQALGFAEADPTADVEGHDVQAKIALLAKLAFG